MFVFKMRNSVPSARYSPVCNVLRLWRIWLIRTYRVYRLYDMLCIFLALLMNWKFYLIVNIPQFLQYLIINIFVSKIMPYFLALPFPVTLSSCIFEVI